MEQLGRVISKSPGRRFVVPDIHGCIKTFHSLWSEIDPLSGDQVFFLGDYINKGPDSKAVLDQLISLSMSHPADLYFLRGNHDQKLLDYYADPSDELREELISMDAESVVDLAEEEKKAYAEFLSATDHFLISGTFILVHAGLDFSLSNPFRDPKSMLNIRGFSYDSKKAMNRSILHGHYPTDLEDIKIAIEERQKIIPLDNGCVYSEKEEQGNLLCLELESWTLFKKSNIENSN